MKYITSMQPMQNTCVAIGHFDGVHKGHIEVIRKLHEAAKEKDLKPVVISLLKTGENVLNTQEEKAYIFEKNGVETMIAMKEEDLPKAQNMVETLGIKAIVSGLGDEKKLIDSDQLEYITIPKVTFEGQEITTALLKLTLKEKGFDQFVEMSGHPYIMIGTVQHGKQLGRTVGMPTANLGVNPFKMQPEDGVYATISYSNHTKKMGLTNIGTRPSVDQFGYKTIETNILDFHEDIYGMKQILEVCFYIRGVQKFNSLEAVKRQVDKDKQKIRERLSQMDEEFI
jgi:riboflavin kinase/FMN adenylyltransferase